MKRHHVLIGAVITLSLLVTGLAYAQGTAPERETNPQAALGTGFTYQGQLSDQSGPVNDTCDLTFQLYDAPGSGSPPTGGRLLGSEQILNHSIVDGLFTVQLDFGSGSFDGDARWLQVTLDCGGGPITLAPRQRLTPAPYALYAPAAGTVPWGGVAHVPGDLSDGDDDTTYTAGTGLELSGGAFSLAASYRLPQSCTNGQIAEWNGSTWVCGDDDTGGGGGGVTAVYAGDGLTATSTTGDVTLAVDFAGSGGADTAARSDHDHWGQTWSAPQMAQSRGDGPGCLAQTTGLTLSGGVTGLEASGSGRGVHGETSGGFGSAVYGLATAPSGEAKGVHGQSNADEGRGVYGFASAPSGTTYGVYGRSNSPQGHGVYGWASASSGLAYGVYGLSRSAQGRGVYGEVNAASGNAYGVFGKSSSESGRGVRGEVSASSGDAYGVEGVSYSDEGRGVYGYAGAPSGEAYGVVGRSYSDQGRGVYGLADRPSGHTYGVYGKSLSPDGRGVYGVATSGSGDAYGVTGESQSSDGRGVYGFAGKGFGETYGVYGKSISPDGQGVHGLAASLSGNAYGVHGESQSSDGRGVYGVASALTGDTYGVYGESASYYGSGVFGHATNDSGQTYGLYGLNRSSAGMGVYGKATSSNGSGGYPYGVHGHSNKGHGVYGTTDGDEELVSGVYGEASQQYASGVIGRNTGTGVGVYAWAGDGTAIVAKGSGSILKGYDTSPTPDLRFQVNNMGEVSADGSFHSGGADFAEMLPAADGLEPGDVLVVGPDGALLRSTTARDPTVVGVHSTQPGFVGGSDAAMENPGDVPLAVMGVVPVKASAENGPISPGDLLTTSSTPGHAMKANADPAVGTVIGKALEGLDEGTGVIQMLVMLQ